MFSNEKYYVTNHDYFNTGGSIMVSIFTVYDRKLNTTRYVIANEEGFNVQTADTISCAEEFEHEELEKIVLESHDWSALTCEPAPWDMLFEDDDWKLYKYCQFEFYKRDCKHFKYKVKVPANWLTPEMYDKLSPAERNWLMENDVDVETDGESFQMPQAYYDCKKEQYEKQLQELKNFKEWLDDLVNKALADETIEKLYNEKIKLTFKGKEIELEFDADNYNNVSLLLGDAIENF